MVAGWGVDVSLLIHEICTLGPVMPVIEIDDAEMAAPLAEALSEGGIHVLEITLRTPAALKAIETVAKLPGVYVGAGTILSPKDMQLAKNAGAAFVVSPGYTIEMIEASKEMDFPFLPGAVTPSEMISLLNMGFKTQKLFPAEVVGGCRLLKAVSGPLANVKFCPTGGVSPENAPDYLQLPNVVCVGGSWVASRQLIKDQAWDVIKANAEVASQLSAD